MHTFRSSLEDGEQPPVAILAADLDAFPGCILAPIASGRHHSRHAAALEVAVAPRVLAAASQLITQGELPAGLDTELREGLDYLCLGAESPAPPGALVVTAEPLRPAAQLRALHRALCADPRCNGAASTLQCDVRTGPCAQRGMLWAALRSSADRRAPEPSIAKRALLESAEHAPLLQPQPPCRGVRWSPADAAWEAFLPRTAAATVTLQPAAARYGRKGALRVYVGATAQRPPRITLGLFPTAHEASRAHDAAVRSLHLDSPFARSPSTELGGAGATAMPDTAPAVTGTAGAGVGASTPTAGDVYDAGDADGPLFAAVPSTSYTDSQRFSSSSSTSASSRVGCDYVGSDWPAASTGDDDGCDDDGSNDVDDEDARAAAPMLLVARLVAHVHGWLPLPGAPGEDPLFVDPCAVEYLGDAVGEHALAAAGDSAMESAGACLPWPRWARDAAAAEAPDAPPRGEPHAARSTVPMTAWSCRWPPPAAAQLRPLHLPRALRELAGVVPQHPACLRHCRSVALVGAHRAAIFSCALAHGDAGDVAVAGSGSVAAHQFYVPQLPVYRGSGCIAFLVLAELQQEQGVVAAESSSYSQLVVELVSSEAATREAAVASGGTRCRYRRQRIVRELRWQLGTGAAGEQPPRVQPSPPRPAAALPCTFAVAALGAVGRSFMLRLWLHGAACAPPRVRVVGVFSEGVQACINAAGVHAQHTLLSDVPACAPC